MSDASIVFVVQHENPESADVKLIGVYSTALEADAAVGRLRGQPGFLEAQDGFTVDTYVLNQDHWTEGFGNAFE